MSPVISMPRPTSPKSELLPSLLTNFILNIPIVGLAHLNRVQPLQSNREGAFLLFGLNSWGSQRYTLCINGSQAFQIARAKMERAATPFDKGAAGCWQRIRGPSLLLD